MCVDSCLARALTIQIWCVTHVLGSPVFHRQSLPLSSRELIPDPLGFLDKLPIGRVSCLVWPGVDQLPLSSTLGLVSLSLQQLLSSESFFLLRVHLCLLARKNTGLHLGPLLFEQTPAFAD